MKRIRYILMPFMCLAFFASCQDAVDIQQPGLLLADNTFQTVGDLEKGINACYIPFASSSGPDTEIEFASTFTDEVRIGQANNGQGILDGAYTFTLTTNTGAPNAIWQSNYTLINYANRVIAGAQKITPSQSDQARYDNAVAQARIFRAWGHFKLLSYFSPDMTDDSAQGVILMTSVPKVTDYFPRVSNKEVYDVIQADLDFAESHLTGDLLSNPSPRILLSKDFLYAFRARLGAYRGNSHYDEAFAYANLLKNTGNYNLSPTSTQVTKNDYKKIWTDDSSISTNEVIFKLKRLATDAAIGKTWAFNNSHVNGQPFYEMGTNLFNLLNNSKDARKASFIDPTSTAAVHCIGKYPTPTGKAWVNDIKIFRMSEMYFITAEYYASKGDYNQVQATLQAINNVRFTSSPPAIPLPASATEAWAEILKQRRIELCYEGHRYLDLKRLGALAGLNNGTLVTVDRNTLDCEPYNACGPVDAYKFTLPIPNNELKANPVISKQQNTGY